MIKRITKLCFLGLLLGFVACTEATIDMVYNETQCADPWNSGLIATDLELIDAVDKHFDDLSISVSDINISKDGTLELCLACTCTTERRIHLKVDVADKKVLEDLGFTME